MGMMGMLPMIGKMVGHPSAITGFLVHLVISALIGVSFAVVFHRFVHAAIAGLGYGLLYGGAWWFLGPLTLMPLFMGMSLGVNWNATAASQMLPSLVGHLIYGTILGLSYAWLRNRRASVNRPLREQWERSKHTSQYSQKPGGISLKLDRLGDDPLCWSKLCWKISNKGHFRREEVEQ